MCRRNVNPEHQRLTERRACPVLDTGVQTCATGWCMAQTHVSLLGLRPGSGAADMLYHSVQCHVLYITLFAGRTDHEGTLQRGVDSSAV